MSILKKAAKEIGKAAKSVGNAAAREMSIKRPFATKTEKLNTNNQEVLIEIKNFIEIAKKTQELCSKIKFSYLEKLSREVKDKCKTLFPKISKELSITDQELKVYLHEYFAIRNKYLNELYKKSIPMWHICNYILSTYEDTLETENSTEQTRENMQQLNKNFNLSKTDETPA